MKKLFIGLVVVSILSIGSVAHAGYDYWGGSFKIRLGYGDPVVISIISDYGRHKTIWAERHRNRHIHKQTYIRHKPYGKRFMYQKKFFRRGYYRPYMRYDRYDRYDRHYRFNRHDKQYRHDR